MRCDRSTKQHAPQRHASLHAPPESIATTRTEKPTGECYLRRCVQVRVTAVSDLLGQVIRPAVTVPRRSGTLGPRPTEHPNSPKIPFPPSPRSDHQGTPRLRTALASHRPSQPPPTPSRGIVAGVGDDWRESAGQGLGQAGMSPPRSRRPPSQAAPREREGGGGGGR